MSESCPDGYFSCHKDCCVRGLMYCNDFEQRCPSCATEQHLCGTFDMPRDCDLFCHNLQYHNDTSTTSPAQQADASGLSTETIALIAVSAVFFIVVCAFTLYCLRPKCLATLSKRVRALFCPTICNTALERVCVVKLEGNGKNEIQSVGAAMTNELSYEERDIHETHSLLRGNEPGQALESEEGDQGKSSRSVSENDVTVTGASGLGVHLDMNDDSDTASETAPVKEVRGPSERRNVVKEHLNQRAVDYAEHTSPCANSNLPCSVSTSPAANSAFARGNGALAAANSASCDSNGASTGDNSTSSSADNTPSGVSTIRPRPSSANREPAAPNNVRNASESADPRSQPATTQKPSDQSSRLTDPDGKPEPPRSSPGGAREGPEETVYAASHSVQVNVNMTTNITHPMGDHCGQSLHNHGYNVSDADASCKDESGKASDSYHSMPGRPNTNRPSSTQNQYGFCDYPRPQMHSGVPDTSGRRRGHGGGLPSSQGVVMPDDRHVRSPGGPRLIGVTPENQGLDAHEMIIAPGTRNPIGNGRALVDSGTQ